MEHILQVISTQQSTKSSLDYIILLTSALLLSLIMLLSYRRYTSVKTLVYDRSFAITLVLVSIIVTAIIVTLGTNIALSLGLIGSLSIIRFRSAIKNPIDLAFLFWAIAIGLTVGSVNFFVGLTTSVFLTLVILGLQYAPHFILHDEKLHILIMGDQHLDEKKMLEHLNPIVSHNHVLVRSILRTKSTVEVALELKGCNEKDASQLSQHVDKLKGVISVSVINPRTIIEQ